MTDSLLDMDSLLVSNIFVLRVVHIITPMFYIQMSTEKPDKLYPDIREYEIPKDLVDGSKYHAAEIINKQKELEKDRKRYMKLTKKYKRAANILKGIGLGVAIIITGIS
jgi:hypothetical protein